MRGVNDNPTNSSPETPGAQLPRKRLRMQPLAADGFTTFVYACIWALMIGEFVALFWLDLF